MSESQFGLPSQTIYSSYDFGLPYFLRNIGDEKGKPEPVRVFFRRLSALFRCISAGVLPPLLCDFFRHPVENKAARQFLFLADINPDLPCGKISEMYVHILRKTQCLRIGIIRKIHIDTFQKTAQKKSSFRRYSAQGRHGKIAEVPYNKVILPYFGPDIIRTGLIRNFSASYCYFLYDILLYFVKQIDFYRGFARAAAGAGKLFCEFFAESVFENWLTPPAFYNTIHNKVRNIIYTTCEHSDIIIYIILKKGEETA